MSRFYLTSGRARYDAPAAVARRWVPRPLIFGCLVLSMSCGHATEESGLVASIEVTPASLALAAGAARPLVATVRDDAGTPISGPVHWTSEDARVATVSEQGVVTGIAAGKTQVAASREGKSAVVPVDVTGLQASLVRVSPTTATVLVGGSATLRADVLDTGGSTIVGMNVIWRSASTSIATVDANGVVSGVARGSTVITASAVGLSGSAGITVQSTPTAVASVTISPSSATLQVGKTVQLAATPRDGSGKALSGRTVTWSSSDITRATVVNGLVLGVRAGTVTIRATSEGITGTATVTVR